MKIINYKKHTIILEGIIGKVYDDNCQDYYYKSMFIGHSRSDVVRKLKDIVNNKINRSKHIDIYA